MDNLGELFQSTDTAEVMLPGGRRVKVEVWGNALRVTVGGTWDDHPAPWSNSGPIELIVSDQRTTVHLPTPTKTALVTPSTTMECEHPAPWVTLNVWRILEEVNLHAARILEEVSDE